jgi:6-phosphogluconolactonase
VEPQEDQLLKSAIAPLTRRGFLRTSSVLASTAAAVPMQAQTGQIIAYVGAYTTRGRGIHMFYLNQADGTLTPWKVLTGIRDPSSIAFHPNKRFLYAVNEFSAFNGTTTGSVTSMAVDSGTGDLRIMNVVSSGGGGPAHLSVDPAGKFVFAANYGGGSVAVLPINADGTLGAPVDVQRITGTLGPQPAVDAPPGSFAISGHDAPHAHMAQTDAAGNFLFVCDLGTDRVYIYRLDKQTGRLTPNTQASFPSPLGAGPRHFVFHPNNRWFYVITEESSHMLLADYDANTGTLTYRQMASTLPEGYAGTNFPSGVLMSSDGNFLYGLNRLHDTVVIFEINPDGWMLNPRHVWTQGSYPRDLQIEPNGNFMYVAHSRSDNVTSFRIDKTTGGLTFTGQFIPVGNPSKIEFLRL